MQVLEWAREKGCEWDEEVCYGAALSGNLEMLKWAWQNNCSCTQQTRFYTNPYNYEMRIGRNLPRNVSE